MTQQIVEIWQEMHGLSRLEALVELKILGDILASNKKTPAGTEVQEMQTHTILPQLEPDAYADPNQICIEV